MAQPITFPRQTFAKLSPHPFLLANLRPTDSSIAPPARTNGRAPREPRPINVNTGSLSHTHGSAVVRVGDTTVICGVRGEVLPVAHIPNYRAPPPMPDTDDDDCNDENGNNDSSKDAGNVTAGVEEEKKDEERELCKRELRDYDLIVPNIELATGCAPQFLPGVPPTALAQTLSSRVYSLLHSAELLNIADLRIWDEGAGPRGGKKKRSVDDDEEMEEAPSSYDGANSSRRRPQIKAYWTLFIDVLFISFDGNPFDVALAAVVAALRDTRLPRATWDADLETVVCSCAAGPALPLSVRGMPVACTAAVFRAKEDADAAAAAGDEYWVLLDPDRLEESLCDEFVTVVVDRSTGADCRKEGKTRVLSILKTGGTAAGLDFMRKLLEVAESRWEEVRNAVDAKA